MHPRLFLQMCSAPRTPRHAPLGDLSQQVGPCARSSRRCPATLVDLLVADVVFSSGDPVDDSGAGGNYPDTEDTSCFSAPVLSALQPKSFKCSHPVVVSASKPLRVSCADSYADSKRALPHGVRRAFGLPSDLKALSESDFGSLSGIGPKLARRIVEERKRRGGLGSGRRSA
jgi:hypothetical protein